MYNHRLSNFKNIKKTIYMYLTLSVIFVLTGCGIQKKHLDTSKNVKAKPSFEDIEKGMVLVSSLGDPNLSLEDMKRIFGEKFDESSKTFNAKTQSTEYKFYPYGRSVKPIVVGFNNKKQYTYLVDSGGTKNPKPPRIVKIKDID
jgi:hypothetical protein